MDVRYSVPGEFLCPFLKEMMKDPVVVSTGQGFKDEGEEIVVGDGCEMLGSWGNYKSVFEGDDEDPVVVSTGQALMSEKMNAPA
ncbi:hypothetical protein QQ045_032960 [Rhodiola kirilowii]